MDIRRNKTIFHTCLKDFTLTATASAILALTAETAMAINSCPSVIIGSTYANITCDFDPQTGSILTVEQGGTLGGIAMNGYNAPPPSSIQIDAGGLIRTSTSTAVGIAINSSSLSNGLTNNGTINNTGSAAPSAAIGLHIIGNSTVGGIVNNGTISINNPGSLDIQIDNSLINADIKNTGTISSQSATSIYINNNSTINGNIINTGTIQGGGNGESLIITHGSAVVGDISNSGLIAVTGIGNALQISLSTTVVGNITNSGMITSTSGSALDVVFGATVTGSIANSGSISGAVGGLVISQSVVEGNVLNTGSISGAQTTSTSIRYAGVYISSAHIGGSISNSGTISGNKEVGLNISQTSHVNGGITNSGMISGNTEGVRITSSSVIHDDILNSGTISGNIAGVQIYNAASIGGSIFNYGTISGGTTGLQIQNSLSQTTVVHGIANHGTITGNTKGLNIFNGITVDGTISNSGIITGNTTGINIASTTGNLATRINENIINSGTITGGTNGINISSNATINGNITNSGKISGNTGIRVTGSSTTLSGGITNSGTIQGDVVAIDIDPFSMMNTIDILGQSARIIGTVNASNATVNITNGTTFTSEGLYSVATFNIATNAVLNMNNSIHTLNGVNNAGKLVVADSVQTITGNYTQNAGGRLQTNISSTTDYGQLAITGTADFSSSGDIYVQVDEHASITADSHLNILNSSFIIAPSDGFSISTNSYMWDFTPEINTPFVPGSSLNLIATINPAVSQICKGSYCQGAATTITEQVAAGNSVFGPYATLPTADALQLAVSQATPELINENIQVLQLITRSVLDIVPMLDPAHDQLIGGAMLNQPGKVWVKPYGTSMTQNQRNTVDGFNASAYGAVIGKDIQLPHDWLLGGAFAVGEDTIRGKSVLHGQSIHGNTYQGIVYGAKQFANHIYLAGQSLIGYGANNTSRAIPLYTSTAKGSYNSWFTHVRAEAGWSTYVLSPKFIFTPEIDASYLFINQRGYQESGSPMNLLINASNNSLLTLGAYGNGAYHLATLNNGQDVTLTGYAGVAKTLIDNQPQTRASFIAGGPTFSTFGVQFNELVFRAGTNLVLAGQNQPFSIELNYDTQIGNNAQSNVGAITLKYKMT